MEPRSAEDGEDLLAEAHIEGGAKARFFLRFGFTTGSPDHRAYAILKHAQPETCVGEAISAFGDVKDISEGAIDAPDGRKPRIRTVWRIDGRRTARFVTAVPLRM